MAISLTRSSSGGLPVATGETLPPVLAQLVANGRVSGEMARRAVAEALAQRDQLVTVLCRNATIEPREWAETSARALGVPLVGADELPKEPFLLDRLNVRFLRHQAVLPVRMDETTVWLAMADPSNDHARKAVAVATRREVVPLVAPLDELQRAFARYWDEGQKALQRIVDDIGGDIAETGNPNVDELIGQAQEAPVVRLVNQLLTDAARARASDIHIDPQRDHLRVRYRVHGRLREVGAPPARLAAAVVSRIKILAKLDIAERRLPQDGRARLTVLGRRIDLRIATAPSAHGESVVIRLLDMSAAAVEFPDLGIDPDIETRLKRQLQAPYGMLLVTGPTGSGKTTTLYAALRFLNNAADKLISIEDPIEYQIEGVTQIQVKPEIGLDFARILRSVVRHDPNIIMVGETRDPETADIAVHAALTGHLLLSTLHTNNAAGAVARLLDMGVEPYLLASVLRGVVGQRLVGVLCAACRQGAAVSDAERAFFDGAGVPVHEDAHIWRPGECEACEGTGFTGRVAIFEFLEIGEAVRELVRGRAPTQAVASAAAAAGMRTMLHDGLSKCLEGITTLEEVCRVTEDW